MVDDLNWTTEQIKEIYELPFNDLIYQAHTVHKTHQPRHEVQLAKLLSIKTGACPEDCGYCSQSGHHQTTVNKEKLLSLQEVLVKAREAKAEGATRFCMGAAWRHPPQKSMQLLKEMIQAVKDLGLETCMTLGMLTSEQAKELKDAGLDFYNHNIDTSPNYYPKITSTRNFQDRLNTLNKVREAGINVCCGGILGLGENQQDRIDFLFVLANMNPQPESVPINQLIRIAGTPLSEVPPIDGFEIVRTIASARIIMPQSKIRLTAGRTSMNEALQALCYFAGANSIFIGDTLLTAENPSLESDKKLLTKLNLQALASSDAC